MYAHYLRPVTKRPAAPIYATCCHMGQKLRRHERLKWNRVGTITALTGGDIINCWVADVSAGGAKLLVPTPEIVPDYFRLQFGDPIEPKCSVRWRRGKELGVMFLTR